MVLGVEDRVARAGLAHRSHARNHVSDFARTQLISGNLTQLVVSDFIDLVYRLARAERDVRSLSDHSVDYAHAWDRAAILVVVRVVDQRAKGSVLVAPGRRDLAHDLLEEVADSDAFLRADEKDFAPVDAEEVGYFLTTLLRLGSGEIDLVENGNDLQARVHRQEKIGESLGLDSLGRIDDEDRAFTRGK